MSDTPDESQEQYDPLLDPENLALVTGISVEHLQGMLNGELEPSYWHRERIAATVGHEVLDKLDHHHLAQPESIPAPRGQVPEGYHLVRRILGRDLRVGDLIAYTGQGTTKLDWVRVDSVVAGNRAWDMTLLHITVGGVDMTISSETTAFRIARRNEPEDGAGRAG